MSWCMRASALAPIIGRTQGLVGPCGPQQAAHDVLAYVVEVLDGEVAAGNGPRSKLAISV